LGERKKFTRGQGNWKPAQRQKKKQKGGKRKMKNTVTLLVQRTTSTKGRKAHPSRGDSAARRGRLTSEKNERKKFERTFGSKDNSCSGGGKSESSRIPVLGVWSLTTHSWGGGGGGGLGVKGRGSPGKKGKGQKEVN